MQKKNISPLVIASAVLGGIVIISVLIIWAAFIVTLAVSPFSVVMLFVAVVFSGLIGMAANAIFTSVPVTAAVKAKHPSNYKAH